MGEAVGADALLEGLGKAIVYPLGGGDLIVGKGIDQADGVAGGYGAKRFGGQELQRDSLDSEAILAKGLGERDARSAAECVDHGALDEAYTEACQEWG